MKTIFSYLVPLVLSLAVVAGCESVKMSTIYTVDTFLKDTMRRPLTIEELYEGIEIGQRVDSVMAYQSIDPYDAPRQVTGHIFYADTSMWEITTLDDAVAGVLRNRYTSESAYPVFSGTPDEQGHIHFGTVTNKDLMIVAVDLTRPDFPMWAWRVAKTAENLPEVSAALIFDRLRFGSYVNAKWNMINPEDPSTSEQEGESGNGG